jgi:hypothetical protein
MNKNTKKDIISAGIIAIFAIQSVNIEWFLGCESSGLFFIRLFVFIFNNLFFLWYVFDHLD